MMLCKLSFSNIKKSMKDYAIYFFTLILGVCIFYIFNSIDSQTAMLKVSASTYEMIDLLKTCLSAISIFVSCVLGFLIIYASRFLIKKRNKEFGIYMLLGMSKRKISTMLLIETFLIGVISLSVGLGIGILLSQITSIFIAKLFNADMTAYVFNFSLSATIKTLIYFGIIYLIVMLFNTIIISKCKLIDLLQASKKSEKIRLKNPVLCVIFFVLSVALLASAYYMVTDGFHDIFMNKSFEFILVPIGMGIVGTVLFFWSLSGMFLKIISKCKNIYFRKLNVFTFKELSSQISTMVVSISVICIMMFLTICLLASALSIKDYFNNGLEKYAPADVAVQVFNDGEDVDLLKLYKDSGLYNEFVELVVVKLYEDEAFGYIESLGNYYETLQKQYPYSNLTGDVYIMSLSDYNRLSSIMNMEKIQLENDEYAIVCNYEMQHYNTVIANNNKLIIFGYTLKPGLSKVVEGHYWLQPNASNIGFFVVPDFVIDEGKCYSWCMVGNYKTDVEEEVVSLNQKVGSADYNSSYSYTNKIEIKEDSIGISVLTTFIGIYLGLIFLISSSAIISLKCLSDAIDSRDKYRILRNIGSDEKEINKALFKQLLIFFALPILLATVHTIFGIKFCLLILESLGIFNITKSIIITAAMMLVIYGGYFAITYSCSKNILKERINVER